MFMGAGAVPQWRCEGQEDFRAQFSLPLPGKDGAKVTHKRPTLLPTEASPWPTPSFPFLIFKQPLFFFFFGDFFLLEFIDFSSDAGFPSQVLDEFTCSLYPLSGNF